MKKSFVLRHFAVAFLFGLITAGFAGCGDSNNPATDVSDDVSDAVSDVAGDASPDSVDAGSDAGVDVEDVKTDGQDAGADSAEDLVPFENGAVALEIESASELIQGPMATGTVGDIMLKNKFVRFIVRTQEIGLYSPFGGDLVDADLVRAEGDEGHEKLLELFPMVGFGRALKPESIEIIDDGTYSGRAVVRITGRDHGMPVVDMLTPTAPAYLDVTMDYVLGPDSHEIEVDLTVTNGASYEQDISIGAFLQFGKRYENFYHQCGSSKECITGRSDLDWLGATAKDMTLAFTTEAGKNPTVVLAQDDILLIETAAGSAAPGKSVSVKQYLIVTEGSMDNAAARAWELRGSTGLEKLTGTVTLAESITDINDVRVHARTAGATGKLGWMTSAKPSSDGSVELTLPEGQYDLTITAPGAQDKVVTGISVSRGGANSFAVEMNKAGRLHVVVNDGDGNLLPAGIMLLNGHDAPATQPGVFQAIDRGDRSIAVKAGEYTIVAMKGFEYDIQTQNVTVVEGETTHAMANLNHVIDTAGMLTMTAHDHSEYSIDASSNLNDRVHNALACGIEIPMLTEHDYFASLQPFIEQESMTAFAKSTYGIEISPLGFHSIGLNCKTPPPYPQYFSIRFGDYDQDGMLISKYTPNQLFDQARNAFGCDYVGVAHPWEGSAMFNYVGLAPEDDPADTVDLFDPDKVNGLEILNSDDGWSDLTRISLAGWFGLIDHGYNVFAVGGADQDEYIMEFGYPLNLVKSPTDSVADVALDDVFANLKTGRNLVYAGPYVTVNVAGSGMGDVADLSVLDSLPTMNITVQAPTWMNIEFVRVFANGVMILDQALPAGPRAAIDVFSTDMSLGSLSTDTYIVVVAGSSSEESKMPGYGRPPISVTNPVFIDMDGDGWEPPLAM